MHEFEKLIDLMLTKSEQAEEEEKLKSELKNLTHRQITCINSIGQLNNPIPSELATEMGITKPSATAMIEKLVKRDLVRKIPSDKDHRMAHLHLTSKGKQVWHLHNSIHSSFARRLLKSLNDSEKDILTYLLNKAVQGL